MGDQLEFTGLPVSGNRIIFRWNAYDSRTGWNHFGSLFQPKNTPQLAPLRANHGMPAYAEFFLKDIIRGRITSKTAYRWRKQNFNQIRAFIR